MHWEIAGRTVGRLRLPIFSPACWGRTDCLHIVPLPNYTTQHMLLFLITQNALKVYHISFSLHLPTENVYWEHLHTLKCHVMCLWRGCLDLSFLYDDCTGSKCGFRALIWISQHTKRQRETMKIIISVLQKSFSCLERQGLPSQRPDTGPVVQKHRFNVASSPRLT